jgi:hypothetical protein
MIASMIAVGRAAATGSETTQIARPSPPAQSRRLQPMRRKGWSVRTPHWSGARLDTSATRQIPHGDGLDLGAQALHRIAVDARKQPRLAPFLRFGSRREMSA